MYTNVEVCKKSLFTISYLNPHQRLKRLIENVSKTDRFPSYVKHGGLWGLTPYQPWFLSINAWNNQVMDWEKVLTDTRLKAGSHLRMIQSSHFIVALVVTQHIMNYAKPIYQTLQKADCDIVKAYIDANTCKKVFRKQREDNTFRNLWGKIVALADSVDEVIEIARTARRMAHRSTAGEIDATAMQYFKVNVFFPFIDHCLM